MFCAPHQETLDRVAAELHIAWEGRERSQPFRSRIKRICRYLDCADPAKPDSRYCTYHETWVA